MDDIFLIEIRLAMTKWRIRETITYVGRLFALEGYLERHPHITLFGPFTLNDGVTPRQLIDKIGQAASGYDPIPFTLDGWEMRQGIHGGVIAFPVRPSYPLKKLTASLAELLSPLAHSHNIWDANPESKWFHVTIANRIGSNSRHRPFFLCSPVSRRKSSRREFFQGCVIWCGWCSAAEKGMQSSQLPWMMPDSGLR